MRFRSAISPFPAPLPGKSIPSAPAWIPISLIWSSPATVRPTSPGTTPPRNNTLGYRNQFQLEQRLSATVVLRHGTTSPSTTTTAAPRATMRVTLNTTVSARLGNREQQRRQLHHQRHRQHRRNRLAHQIRHRNVDPLHGQHLHRRHERHRRHRSLIEPTTSTTSALPTGPVVHHRAASLQLATNVTLGSQSANLPGYRTHQQREYHVSVDLRQRHLRHQQQSHHHQLRQRTPTPSLPSPHGLPRAYAGGAAYLEWIRASCPRPPRPIPPATASATPTRPTPAIPPACYPGTSKSCTRYLATRNLDGKVNGTDFSLMATNFNQAVTAGWDEGDFNYDGKVNGSDFVLLADNFNQFATNPPSQQPIWRRWIRSRRRMGSAWRMCRNRRVRGSR